MIKEWKFCLSNIVLQLEAAIEHVASILHVYPPKLTQACDVKHISLINKNGRLLNGGDAYFCLFLLYILIIL